MSFRIGVVPGFGPVMTAELRLYLDEVAAMTVEEQLGILILCGARTQEQTAPDTSEAKVMFEYLRPRQLRKRKSSRRRSRRSESNLY